MGRQKLQAAPIRHPYISPQEGKSGCDWCGCKEDAHPVIDRRVAKL